MKKIDEFLRCSIEQHIRQVHDLCPRSTNANSSNVFGKILCLDVSSDIFEIPACLQDLIFIKTKHLKETPKFISPLYCANVETLNKRNTSSILSAFIRLSSNSMVRAKNGDGNIYHGLPGVIFDADMKILFSVNVVVKRDKDLFIPQEYICRMSPLLFQNKDRSLEKAIIKGMTEWPCMDIHDRYGEVRHIKIIIDNTMDSWVIKPVPPRPDKNIEDKFRSILLEHIDEVLNANN